MWEKAARHNPLSLTNYYYLDHRPFLPQDPTFNHLWRKQYSNYLPLYIKFKINGSFRILFLNNIPANERERIKLLIGQYSDIKKCFTPLALMASAFLTGGLMKTINKISNYKILNIVTFGLLYFTTKRLLTSQLNYYHNVNVYYYLQKYEHLTVDDINKIKDPRRKFFRLDTSQYYRETPEEVLHHGHDEDHHDHDTTTYYGPYPYDDYMNLNDVKEIEKKIKTGHSKYDDPEYERLLDDPIDIKRIIRRVPTFEEYKKI